MRAPLIRVMRESHEAPECVRRRLAAAGGTNRFGEANFRVVWGGARLGWIGGKWEDRDADGTLIRECISVRLEPKYVPLNRWHIERWCPAEMYGSPEEWNEATAETVDGHTVAALGPYPSRGEYEHVMTLAGPRGEFVQLTSTVVEQLAQLIERSRAMPGTARRAALGRHADLADRRYDAWADDVLGDAGPAFDGVPHVTVPGGIRTNL
jgi:hypothetical protein